MRVIRYIHVTSILIFLTLCSGCIVPDQKSQENLTPPVLSEIDSTPLQRLHRLQFVSLAEERANIPVVYQQAFPWLLKASAVMDDIFWKQAYGDKRKLLQDIEDKDLCKLIQLNYGPYDRLDDNTRLIAGIEEKPLGANFYPEKIGESEFEKLERGQSKLTLIRRDEDEELIAIPYNEVYKEELAEAATYLRTASSHLDKGRFKEFLLERARALETDQYPYSDGLWLGLWDETIDMLIGPIESYEDGYKGIKSAYQACIVQKDRPASLKIAPLLELLPKLKLDLKTKIRYERQEFPQLESVGVYNALHFSGLFNAGSKSMGLNAPHFTYPREVESKGKRRLILKNIVDAKYGYIAVPIGEALLDSAQQKYLTPDAFFQYVLFHELSHGWELMPSARTSNEKSIQEYLLEYASIMEEGKGDILGLYMITQAYKQNLTQAGSLESHFVTSLVNTLRAVRFGRNSDHAIANVIRLNFFLEKGAYVFDEKTGRFAVRFEKMESTIKSLVEEILSIQASGDANTAMNWKSKYGSLKFNQEKLLDTFSSIPVDLRFE